MKRIICSIFCISLFTIMLAACNQRKNISKEEPPAIKNQRDSILENAAQKRNQWHQQLKQMNTEQLMAELSTESLREMESFNSSAFKELVSRGEKTADSVKNGITRNDRSSLLSLTALSIIDMRTFQQVNNSLKADIFTDAFKQYKKFNAFGLPHVKWEDAAKAIIASGDTVKRALYPLLKDTSAAPVWGSEDYFEYQKYQYRVCDYILGIVLFKEGKNTQLPASREERDKMIDNFTR